MDPGYRLPDLGRADALVLVVGNSRALWPRFRTAMGNPARRDRPDPFDTWVEEEVGAALAGCPIRHEVRHAHEAPPRRVAMVRLAELAGLCHLGPAHLAVHPELGPWFSLRAAIVLDLDPPGEVPAAPDPCATCEGRPCVPAMEAALAASRPEAPGDLGEGWRLWLAVRDACPEGRDARFPEDQIAYHYTKDPAALGADPA